MRRKPQRQQVRLLTTALQKEHRGSISNRGRWTRRQNLPGKREAKADRRNSRNAPGNSERTGLRYARVARYKNRFGFGSGKPAARPVDRGRAWKKGLADLPQASSNLKRLILRNQPFLFACPNPFQAGRYGVAQPSQIAQIARCTLPICNDWPPCLVRDRNRFRDYSGSSSPRIYLDQPGVSLPSSSL